MRFRNIEAERVRNSFSKEVLSSKLGISTKTYYNWINGETPIPSTALLKMVDLFGVSLDYLLGISPIINRLKVQKGGEDE